MSGGIWNYNTCALVGGLLLKAGEPAIIPEKLA
jgi:hypothetical protein